MQLDELLVAHLVDLIHFGFGVGGNELLDDHESAAHSDDQLAVQDFRVNLLGSEKIETISDLSDWNGAVCLVDVVTEHLVEQVSLWKLENGSLLLIANSHVHDLDDLVLVFEESFHFLDLVDLLGNTLREVVQSLQ